MDAKSGQYKKRCEEGVKRLLNNGRTNVKQFMDNDDYKSRGIETSSVQEGMPAKDHIRKNNMGYVGHIINHSILQHALLEGKIGGRGRPRTMWTGNKTVVRIWLSGGNKEGTGQGPLAATHCVRPDPAMDRT